MFKALSVKCMFFINYKRAQNNNLKVKEKQKQIIYESEYKKVKNY